MLSKKSRGILPMISFKPFRDMMEQRGITTYYLRNKCGYYNLDSKTIKRLMNDESVSSNTINSLCHIFDCDFIDIMEFIPDTENTEQEII